MGAWAKQLSAHSCFANFYSCQISPKELLGRGAPAPPDAKAPRDRDRNQPCTEREQRRRVWLRRSRNPYRARTKSDDMWLQLVGGARLRWCGSFTRPYRTAHDPRADRRSAEVRTRLEAEYAVAFSLEKLEFHALHRLHCRNRPRHSWRLYLR